MAIPEKAPDPYLVEQQLEDTSKAWLRLASRIVQVVENSDISSPTKVAEAMTLMAQAEACSYRATGEDEAISFAIPSLAAGYRIK